MRNRERAIRDRGTRVRACSPEKRDNADRFFVTFCVYTNQTAATKQSKGEPRMKFLLSAAAAYTIALFAVCILTTTSSAQDAHTTDQFHGATVNAGTVTHSKTADRNILTSSNDFKVPEMPEVPDAHWQVVDSKGNVTLCNVSKIRTASSTSQPRYQPIYSRCRESADLVCFC